MIPRESVDTTGLFNADLSLATARRVHVVCREFEADWRRAKSTAADPSTPHGGQHDFAARPQLQSCLAGVVEPERTALLAELLVLELELRSELFDEQPTAAEYVEAFPADTALIETVFRQRRDDSDPTGENGETPRSSRTPRLPCVAGYEVLEVLGRGGHGGRL